MEHLITDGNGKAKRKNPYDKEIYTADGWIDNPYYEQFETSDNEPLPCFTADGEEFREKGEAEGELGYHHGTTVMTDAQAESKWIPKDLMTRCYIITQPSPKPVEGEENFPVKQNNLKEILALLDKQKQLLTELKADLHSEQPLYTEAEVKDIANTFLEDWCLTEYDFDKWWSVTTLNKANR